MARWLGDNRCGVRRLLRLLRLRIRLQRQKLAVRSENLVFVEVTGTQAGHKKLPEPADISHRRPAAVPGIEIADHADATCIRRPHSERHTLDTLMDERMRAEPLIARQVVALHEEVDVELAENRRKTVDVVEFVLDAAARYPQPIAERLLAIGCRRNKEAIPMDTDTLGRDASC